MMKSFLARSLALCLLTSPVAPLWGQGQSADPHGRPEDIEARPPLHFRPFISPSPSGYTVVQMRHAYGFDQVAGNGTGQMIAVVEAFGSTTVQSDLNTFSATFGLPATTVQVY